MKTVKNVTIDFLKFFHSSSNEEQYEILENLVTDKEFIEEFEDFALAKMAEEKERDREIVSPEEALKFFEGSTSGVKSGI